jgi:hypothetical protein
LCLLLFGASLTAASKRAALVVEDVANKGHDTLLYNSLTNDLAYSVRWITPDTVAIRTSAYFDTAFDVVIWWQRSRHTGAIGECRYGGKVAGGICQSVVGELERD